MLSALLTGTTAAVGVDAGSEFAAGYLWGAKQEDKRPYIVSCFKTDEDLNDLLDTIFADYAKGDVKSGDDGWTKATPKFKRAMDACSEVSGEFKDLSDYSKNVDRSVVKARAEKYETEINDLGGNMVHSWQTGVYFDAGMFNGQISAYMGLVPNSYPNMEAVQDQRDPDAVSQFTAGWLYGVSGQFDEDRDTIVSCYKANAKLEDDYFKGFAAYTAGDQKKGDKLFKDAGKHFYESFEDCPAEVADHLHSYYEQLHDLEETKHWNKISKQIYEDNKDIIDQDVALELKWWNDTVYFNAGMYSGRYQKVFLDNAPKEIIGEMLSYL